MALNAYLMLKGNKQGSIKGSVTQKGREGTIAVHSFHHQIISPRDPASGLPTGKRQHRPFTIVKEIDRSSPLLHQALTNNENLTTWELKCYAPKANPAGGAGQEVNNFTITLTNASISDIVDIMENNLTPEDANLPLLEEVSFTYQKIEWTWVDGSVTSEDDWETPNA